MPLAYVVLPALAVLLVALALAAAWRASSAATRARNVALGALGAAAWTGGALLVADAGVLARFEARPPPLAVLLVVALAASLALALSRAGAALARLPVGALVLSQAFRLPLELAMHDGARVGLVPPQMSFTPAAGGWNYDIVTGALALVVGGLALAGRAPRWLVPAWNALGSALLVVVVVVAAASTPTFAAFGPDRLNTWIAHAPYVLLPTVLVPSAIVVHVVLWRALWTATRGPS